jgi:hypothetical protein
MFTQEHTLANINEIRVVMGLQKKKKGMKEREALLLSQIN